jgi:Protein of unknown function (DUF2637)
MTVTTNGDREAVYHRFVAEGGSWTIERVAAETGLKPRAAGDVSRKWKVRMAANAASPASEVAVPPRLPPGPSPRAIEKAKEAEETATRNHRLVVFAEVAVGVVTTVTALMSYSGLRQLALEAGLGWHADILPLAVDGLVAVCLFVTVVLPANRTAWVAMAVALVGSVAANAVAYGPWKLPLGYIAAAMAGFVPVAAAVGYHLLGRMLKECK